MRGAATQAMPKRIVEERQRSRCPFPPRPVGLRLAKPLARRERGAYPLWYVTSEQQSQRFCEPQPVGAWRKGASASLLLLNDALRHRLRRSASHLRLSAHAKMTKLFCGSPLASTAGDRADHQEEIFAGCEKTDGE